MLVEAQVAYKNVTQAANVAVKTTAGDFFGAVVLSSTNGTITVYDNASAASGNVIYSATGLTAGQIIHFGGLGIRSANGLYVVVGGTASVNVLFL